MADNLNRRNFLKGLGALGPVAAVSGCMAVTQEAFDGDKKNCFHNFGNTEDLRKKPGEGFSTYDGVKVTYSNSGGEDTLEIEYKDDAVIVDELEEGQTIDFGERLEPGNAEVADDYFEITYIDENSIGIHSSEDIECIYSPDF